MQDLVFLQNKEARISTLELYKLFGYVNHSSLKQLIKEQESLFLSRGTMPFEIVRGLSETKRENEELGNTRGAGRPTKGFLLNRRQFNLLVMLSRTTEKSLPIKLALDDQFHRMEQALQNVVVVSPHMEAIRKLLMLDAPSEWIKLFPDEFYIALMRLYGDEFKGNKSTPPYCAQITRRWIYDVVLPKELSNEISKGKGEEKKHQWFTESNGREVLLRQIYQVTGIARSSYSRKDFEARCATLYENAPLQLALFV